MSLETDLFVIGGGINGAGIALDAVGRGLSVALCEQDDIASATSQSSSKLIHGGLRYLEHYEFRLVHESLNERARLLHNAPHLVKPLRFVMPYYKKMRPAWLIRLGLFLYDFLDRFKVLPRCKAVLLNEYPDNPINNTIVKGFEYSDCKVDDSRLVIEVAKKARELGAHIYTRTKFMKATRTKTSWEIHLQDLLIHENRVIHAKAIVNAAGPFVDQVIKEGFLEPSQYRLRLVKGSHIVVRRLYQGEQAYILQHRDGRVIFVIPYEKQYTLIGTTDITYKGDPKLVQISPEEVDYLCEAVNLYFHHNISSTDVVWSYAGVRPLKEDNEESASKVTRDYSLELIDDKGTLPLLSIFGGKLTTYRKLAENAVPKLKPYFPHMSGNWTANAVLSGGNLNASLATFTRHIAEQYPFLSEGLRDRLVNCYGSNVHDILKGRTSLEDLGLHFGADLYEAEVRYLIEFEWAETAQDILWRRTKLGLSLPHSSVTKLEEWLSTLQSPEKKTAQSA